MDSDFMTNLGNMLKNGNIPDDLKTKMNQFMNQNTNQDNQTQENKENSQNNSSNTNSISPEMLQNLMSMLNSNHSSSNQDHQNDSSDPSQSSENGFNFDMNTILKMKSIMDKMGNTKDDPRSNLLLSLKPYLKESRKSKVEQYVQLFNMTKIMDVFQENGGEKTK